MKWRMTSRFKNLNKEVELSDDWKEFGDAIESLIYEAGSVRGYPRNRITMEGYTDEWFGYTLDKRTERRRLFVHLIPA